MTASTPGVSLAAALLRRRSGLKGQVLRLDSKGLSARQIADRLGVRTEYVRATRNRAGLTKPIEEYTKAQLTARIKALRALLRSVEGRLQELSASAPGGSSRARVARRRHS